jgi:FkbM family methyltransferase
MSDLQYRHLFEAEADITPVHSGCPKTLRRDPVRFDLGLPKKTKQITRGMLRSVGLDLIRWTPQSSTEAALAKMFIKRCVDTVIDAGANEGQYARLMRHMGFSGKIISFEPLSSAHERLQESAAADPMWKVAPRMALGDHEGEVSIHVASNGGASSSIFGMLEMHKSAAPDVRYVGSELVPISRLDSIVGGFLQDEEKSIFLKVDVQGYELQVLDGANELLKRIVGAQLEVSFVSLYQGQALLPTLIDYMMRRGFEIWGIIPGFTDNSSGRMLQADVIFFRS